VDTTEDGADIIYSRSRHPSNEAVSLYLSRRRSKVQDVTIRLLHANSGSRLARALFEVFGADRDILYFGSPPRQIKRYGFI